MEKTIITWNFANWITIVLMGIVGGVVIGAAISVAKGLRDGSLLKGNGA